MNLILSNKFKRLCAITLCFCVMFSLSACTKNTENIDSVDQICVSGSYSESWMYVYTDEEFIGEMVDIFNSVKYEKSDEAVDMMTQGEVFSFTFSNGNEQKAKFIVDKNLVFTFEAGTQSYKIVSDFDFDYVKELVNEQQKELLETLESTPDEV